MSGREQAVTGDARGEAPTVGGRVLRWLSALLLLSLLAGGGYVLMRWEPQQLPVRVVTVDGKLKRLSPQRLQQTVVDHIRGGILTQDLAELKAAVEAMPWVRSASLRRHWPDRLELTVEEQVPLARWGKDGLVTADGIVFRPQEGDFPRELVLLSGKDEQAPEVVAKLKDWGLRLAALDLGIEELTLDARGAWSLHCSAGFALSLGKARVEERIARFARAYPKLAAVGLPSLVDMRYSNGLAIRWFDAENEDRGRGTGEATQSAKMKSRPSGPSRS